MGVLRGVVAAAVKRRVAWRSEEGVNGDGVKSR